MKSANDDVAGVDQGSWRGSDERWSYHEYCECAEPKGFADGLFVRYERDRGIRDNSDF